MVGVPPAFEGQGCRDHWCCQWDRQWDRDHICPRRRQGRHQAANATAAELDPARALGGAMDIANEDQVNAGIDKAIAKGAPGPSCLWPRWNWRIVTMDARSGEDKILQEEQDHDKDEKIPAS